MRKEMVILVFLLCLLGIEVFLCFDISEKKESYTNYDFDEEKIKLAISKNDKSIIQSYDFVLNKENISLDIVFSIDNKNIIGKYKDINLYVLNGKENEFTEESIYNNFNEANFEIITGQDNQEYLTIRTFNNKDEWISLYVFNNELECLKEFTLIHNNQMLEVSNSFNVWYKDKYNLCNNNCQIRTKIDNNKIYTLVYDAQKKEELDFGVVEERVYTIKENELKYEIIDTYKVISVY